MLQIVTKKYFRPGVPVRSTLHRQVLWTNRVFLRSGTVELPVGQLEPSTGIQPVSAVTVTVTEHLEAENEDGSSAVLVATSGLDLIDDLAWVLSFALNATFSRDGDLVRRLVPMSLGGRDRRSAGSLFRGTFDPELVVQDEELENLRDFMQALLALRRPEYETAMRAIRRVVGATQRAVDDPTVAYVDLVAALESLGEGAHAGPMPWEALDGSKRKPIDAALEGATTELADRVRGAVLEAERAGARRRFVSFVSGSITSAFFREEAVGAVRPVRGADLKRLLDGAYVVRSRRVHSLEQLPLEYWVLGDRAETASPPGVALALTLEGLARMARHVIRRFVEEAPTGLDTNFRWRDSLPGIIRMPVAPQYWVWNPAGFEHRRVLHYFSGFADQLAAVLAGRADAVPDMSQVLEQIEKRVRGTQPGPERTAMVGIYALWHARVHQTGHRPGAARLLASHRSELERPSTVAFAVGLLSDDLPAWTAEEWEALARTRRAERERGKGPELTNALDAALQAIVAGQLSAVGRQDEARELAGWAVQELPGHKELIAWEASVADGAPQQLDVWALALGLDPEEEAGATPGAKDSAEPASLPAERSAVAGPAEVKDAGGPLAPGAGSPPDDAPI